MLAIFRRELGSYFSSPIGYIFLAVYYLFSGYFFLGTTLVADTNSLSGVFQSLFTVLMFIVPLLTMRLMSEDKKLKTDQLLLTSPLNLSSLVYGKFFAALIVFLVGVAITPVYALIINIFAQPEWIVVIGNLVGLILLGAALISIGLFISSLTENQLIAAIGGFAIMMIFMLIDGLSSVIPIDIVKKIIDGISFSTRYGEFTTGIFNISSVLYFISVVVIFNFFTVRVLEKKRWS
ncbi:MAG: hypothetical protein K0R90_183 [Oscillospiraceae bacterium]|jgi:ABC-2 type transport system permease protein|nr:hypothetical protein [Oscillospiraceae bacterium]